MLALRHLESLIITLLTFNKYISSDFKYQSPGKCPVPAANVAQAAIPTTQPWAHHDLDRSALQIANADQMQGFYVIPFCSKSQFLSQYSMLTHLYNWIINHYGYCSLYIYAQFFNFYHLIMNAFRIKFMVLASCSGARHYSGIVVVFFPFKSAKQARTHCWTAAPAPTPSCRRCWVRRFLASAHLCFE